MVSHPTFHKLLLVPHVAGPPKYLPIFNLVMEREFVTGRPGRLFAIVGAERLLYHVDLKQKGMLIRRLSVDGEVLSTNYVSYELVGRHTLGRALRCGQLYTVALD